MAFLLSIFLVASIKGAPTINASPSFNSSQSFDVVQSFNTTPQLVNFSLPLTNSSELTQCKAEPVDPTTKCILTYTEKIITPMGIDYIPLKTLKKIIRYYNYKNYRLPNSGTKSVRRRKRKHYYNNFKLYSHSVELDSLSTVCEINYDKINIDLLKIKHARVLRLLEGSQFYDRAIGSMLMFIIMFLFILMCSS